MTIPGWVVAILGVVGGLILLWATLISLLLMQQRRAGHHVDWREVLRLAPDVIRLISRLARDSSIGWAPRLWLLLLLVYLASPIDLIPDFIPVLGYADDAIVAAVALRFATRHAGPEAIHRHWPGTPAGLQTVLSLTGLAP